MTWLHDDVGLRWLKRAVVVVLLAGVLGFLARGGSRPEDPSLRPVTGGPAPSTVPTIAELPGEP